MKIKEIINEGYKEANIEFAMNANPDIVQSTIEKYKQLVNKNQVTGNERNIDWWRKQGWDAFSKFVNAKYFQPTRTQIKRNQVVGKSITLMENDEWLIIIPLDKNASCFHGRNTDWCTTKNNTSDFEGYYYVANTTLIYCLNKQTGYKWAIAIHEKLPGGYEIYNQNDNKVSTTNFDLDTKLDAQYLVDMAKNEQHQRLISSKREIYKKSVEKVKSVLEDVGILRERIPEIEKELLFTKNADMCELYLDSFDTNYDIPEGIPDIILIIGIQVGCDIFHRLKNPSIKVQKAAIEQDESNIKYIDNPVAEIQIMAFEEDEDVLVYVDNISPELIKKYSTLKNLIQLQSDEVLNNVIEQFNDLLIDYVSHTITEMELNDDYFGKWQSEQAHELGYVDENGDVDWDMVYEDNTINNYLEYSYEAKGFYEGMKDFCASISPEVIRTWSKDLSIDDGDINVGYLYMNNLDDIYIAMLKEDNFDGVDVVVDYVKENIRVYESNGEWKVKLLK